MKHKADLTAVKMLETRANRRTVPFPKESLREVLRQAGASPEVAADVARRSATDDIARAATQAEAMASAGSPVPRYSVSLMSTSTSTDNHEERRARDDNDDDDDDDDDDGEGAAASMKREERSSAQGGGRRRSDGARGVGPPPLVFTGADDPEMLADAIEIVAKRGWQTSSGSRFKV